MFRGLVEIFKAHRHAHEVWSPRESLLGRDRRIFKRVPVGMALKMDNRVFGLQTDGSLMNLSLGGAGLIAAVNWPEGSQVEVVLEEVSFKADAMIVFRKDVSKAATMQFHYGLKFQNIGFAKLIQLRRILSKYDNGPLAV